MAETPLPSRRRHPWLLDHGGARGHGAAPASRRDDDPAPAGQRRDDEIAVPAPDGVGDETGEQGADDEPEVPPEAVDADESARARSAATASDTAAISVG